MAVVFSLCEPFAAFLWFGRLLNNVCLPPDGSYVEERPSTVCRRFCYVLNLTLEELIRQHYSATYTGDLHQPIKGQSRPQLNCCASFSASVGGDPFEFCRDFRRQEAKLPGLSCGVICAILRLAVSVEHRLVTDGRTDGQTDTRRQLIPALACVAQVINMWVADKTV